MLTKSKPPSHPLNGMHTAGLFADMSLDGPIIGTLVAIVDRGKNLPNRKTIGKQDPYCHVRLGKEAKKTSTDIRGGQTPRWDQELRFTVHDSPDYYQLKVSVFTDDKKTDLIGESWIDLRDIVVSGGGQSDKWHGLTCRSKYAGEIRMEITFYDSRPKPEKTVPKLKQLPASTQREEASRLPPKRRPLPSDPVTGQVPTPAAPQHAQTPPRQQPNFIPNQSPLQTLEYQTPPSGRPRGPQQPQQAPQLTTQGGNQYSPHPPSGGSYSYSSQVPVTEASMLEPAPPQRRQVDHHDPYANSYQDNGQYSPGYQGQPPPPQHAQQLQQYAQSDPRYDPRYDGRQGSLPAPSPHGLHPIDDPMQYPPEDDRPPPPPAHRTRHSSSQELTYRSSYDASPVKGTPPTMRHDVLRNEAHRSSFHASAAYPGRPQYKPSDSTPPAVPQHGRADSRDDYHPSLPHHHSYDAGYDAHQRSMQPTVEDMPDSPPSVQQHSYRQNELRTPQYDDSDFGQIQSPAPLNLSGRNSSASGISGHRSPSAVNHPSDCDANYGHSPSPSTQDYRKSSTGPSPNQSFNGGQGGMYMTKSELENNELALVPHKSSSAYRPSEVPASLIPGVDPYLAQDIAERVYEDRRPERRYTQQEISTPTRGRQHSMGNHGSADHRRSMDQRALVDHRGSIDCRGNMDHRGSYGASSSHQYDEPYTPPDWQDDGRALTYAGNNYSASHSGYDNQPVGRMRGTSPAPHHTIKRKSVSPAPPPAENRRHSGVPFGPDSYDEFNPAVAQAKADNPDYSDPDAKIITHDGREIDPSDHLPMSTWAPEPDKTPKETTPEPRSRPSPAGAQPMPSSGRRQIRVQARPQSMAVSSHSYTEHDQAHQSPISGRNRLQKRPTHRMSVLPPPSSSSGPLVPIDNTPGGSGFTPPRHVSRASTFDYSGSENREPTYGSSPGNRGDYRGDFRSSYGARDDDRGYRSSVSGPPVPGKVPLQLTMSGANGGNGRGQDDEWALMQEMQSIDLGSARSRRHRGY